MSQSQRLFEYFQPSHYDLELRLEREKRMFSGTVVIAGTKTGGYEIMLHAKDLHITSVVVDDTSVDFTHEADELTINPDFSAGDYTITVTFDGHITDPMHGLYPCYYEVDGVKKELLATQFESHHAREVFPCVDEPEAKATFDLTLVTESGVEVLSNMQPLARSEMVEEGTAITKFQTTPRMSPYLLAFVIGDLQKVSTETQSGVEVNVYATKAQKATSLTYASSWARRSIEFFEDYFGVPYPLAKSDHVALPDFSVSAMENWGLVTYREAALLADEQTATTETKQYISMVISHELAHQWFGNLVTMKWWDDLWLNESFANLMGYAACDALEPEWHSWDEFSATECFSALKRDALDGVQPVKVAVNGPDEINAIFDHAIVYAKGSRLLKMLHDYIGMEAFRAGLKNYFETYAYTNTTGDDLWNELKKASSIDVGSFMQNWLNLPGYPLVTLTDTTLSQRRFFIGEHEPDETLWQIPLLANSSDFPRMLSEQSISIEKNAAILNMSDGAHFITRYDEKGMKLILAAIHDDTLPTNDTLRLINEWLLLALSGEQTVEPLIRLLAAIREKQDPNIWQAVLGAFNTVRIVAEDDPALTSQLRAFASMLIAKQYARLGWHPKSNEPGSDTRLRPYILELASYSETHDVKVTVRSLYENTPFADMPSSIRATVGRAMIRNGISDEAFDVLLTDYQNIQLPELRTDIMKALASTTAERQIAKIIASLTDGTIRPQDIRRWMVQLLSSPHTRAATWQWIKNEWMWIEKMFRDDITYDAFPTLAGKYLVSEEQLRDYRAFFEPLRDVPAISRAIMLGEKELGANVTFIQNNKQVLAETLANRKETL